MAEEKIEGKPKLKKKEQVRQRIHKYEQRFQKAAVGVSHLHKKWHMLDMFDRGEQWNSSSIPPWVPKPVTNYIRYIRTLKRANLASSIPKATFYPEYEEDKDIVSQLQKGYDYVWESQKIPRTIRRSVDRALLQGTGIAYVYYDDSTTAGKYFGSMDGRNKLYSGEIKVKRFPNANFFIDPDAKCLDDAKWVDTTELLSLNQIKENEAFRAYCKEQGTLKLLDELNTEQLERSDDSSGEIYDRENKITDGDMSIQGDEMVTLHTHWERYKKDGRWKLDITYYLRNCYFELLRIEDYLPNEFPFAVLYDEEEENEFWGSATAMDILENQKIVNKLQQTASIIGVLHQNPQKIVFRESGINAQELARTGTLPGKVWTSNVPGEQAITTIKPMDIPRGLFDLDDRTQQNIREMVGVNEAYTGQSVGSLTTSTGVDSLIERATIRDKDKMLQIDDFVERISHLIVLNIIHNWKEPRPITTIQPNGEAQFDQFQPVDKLTAENLTWRIRSNVYAKSPMTQASRRQQADKLLQTQGQFQFNPPVITPEEWIKMQEFDDMADILKRMEEDRVRMEKEKAQDLAGQITQIAQQISELVSQGVPMEQAVQQAEQAAQELIDQTKAEEMKNGISSNPAKEQQLPQGVTNQVAMSNMANGGMN